MLDTDKDNSNFPCLPIKLWMLVGVSKFRLSPEKKADVDKAKNVQKGLDSFIIFIDETCNLEVLMMMITGSKACKATTFPTFIFQL